MAFKDFIGNKSWRYTGIGGSYNYFLKNVLNPGQYNAFQTALGGLPIVGPIAQATDRYKQQMDIYNATGRTNAYPYLAGGYNGITNIANTLMPNDNNSDGRTPKRNAGQRNLNDFYKTF